MTNSKTTKGALLASGISLLLCFAMLLGTTFAWFTDSVTSAGNVIQAGTLDVDLVDDAGISMAGEVIEFVAADGRAQSAILWEPGCTYKTEPVYVENKGNLALKYEIAINGISGDAKLLEAIEWTVAVDGETKALADLKGELSPEAKSGAIVLTGHMKEEAGNEYQGLEAGGISIAVVATQKDAEKDSFDDQYDVDAKYDTIVSTAEELKTAVADGATNILLRDGEYNVANCGGKTLTISGSKNAVLKLYNEGEDGCDYGFDGSTVTFNGITIDTTANTGNYKGYARMTATFNDCNFVGGGYTTFKEQTFNNCTFDIAGYIWTWGATKVTFDKCTFVGDSRAILAHGSASTVITIKDCDFAATSQGKTWSGDWVAAVEIDPTGTNTYTINFTGDNTLSENYNGWTRVKDGSTGHTITGLN